MFRIHIRALARAAALAALGVLAIAAIAQAHLFDHLPITANPYTGQAGPPDCTWYAWQRLHDTLGIDAQFAAAAGDWAADATQPDAFWSERAQAYVQAQVLPALAATAAKDDVVVFPDAVAHWAYPSHVAYVEGDAQGGRFYISEQSFGDYAPGKGTQPYDYVTHRWVDIAAMRQAEPRASYIRFSAAPPAPAPVDDAIAIGQSPDPFVAPNAPFALSFTMLNTGTTTWSDAAGYALACAQDCLNASNAGATGLAGQRVAPGQEYQFTVALVAPPTPGSYVSSWTLRHGAAPVGNLGLVADLTVYAPASGDGALLLDQYAPTSVAPGQQLQATITLLNIGGTTWSDAGGYRLECDVSSAAAAECLGGSLVGLDGQPVAPGQRHTFVVTLTAPTSPGVYSTLWDLHHDGLVFGDTSHTLAITVGGDTAAARCQWSNQSSGVVQPATIGCAVN